MKVRMTKLINGIIMEEKMTIAEVMEAEEKAPVSEADKFDSLFAKLSAMIRCPAESFDMVISLGLLPS